GFIGGVAAVYEKTRISPIISIISAIFFSRRPMSSSVAGFEGAIGGGGICGDSDGNVNVRLARTVE
ncbi:UNVERIFIED_CONTAM: hypothetical protein Sindi_2844200, partial [Sesamum indicum]